MDFNDTPEEATYRKAVANWLEANAPAHLLPDKHTLSEEVFVEKAKAWQAAKAEGGYICITWPKEIGGQGGTPIQQVIFNQEEGKYRLPLGLVDIGLGMCVPTVIKHGTREHAARYVPPAIRGDEIWCQLFSEPAAGSDLAGIRTRAVKQGENWVINGQKVWTSWGHMADYGIIVTRTDPDVPKHKGLTMFFLDMKSPGIDIRPIRQMSGQSNFNEIFFTDVAVPDSQRLGAVGEGWKVSLTTLMNERLAVGGKPSSAPGMKDLIALAERLETEDGKAIDSSAVRAAIADFYVRDKGTKLARMRSLTALSRGQTPGPEASGGKLVNARMMQDMARFVTDMLGEAAITRGGEADAVLDKFQGAYLWSAGFRIAGGTDEILRNIIAERVLGLPGDVRVDKDVPFKDLPSGG